jgi:predicted acylesterase/phospholipase RssA
VLGDPGVLERLGQPPPQLTADPPLRRRRRLGRGPHDRPVHRDLFHTQHGRVVQRAHAHRLFMPAVTVSADLLSGHMVVHREGPLWEAVGTSMIIPGLVPPRPYEAQLLVDGGILNNLPTDVMAADEPGPIIAVDVMRRITAEDMKRTVRASLPTILETLSRATVLGSIERTEASRSLAQIVITPDVHELSLRDFRRIDSAIDAGRRAAEEAMSGGARDALLAALSSRPVPSAPVA